MAQAEVGVIGGSGLYRMEGLEDVEEIEIETPFGSPSDALTVGTLLGVRIAFLPRHGRGHRLLPSEIPSRANIFAMKALGVRRIIAASAVGSLREELRPMDMVVPDQLFDRTRNRPSTFFGGGIVAHIGFAEPFCPALRSALRESSAAVVERTHGAGTYVCMEGPAFSTLAESTTYRHLGFDVIGMTALPEAKLAREAGICYGMLAQVTDYDCWHEGHDTVSNDMVMANVARNVANSREILRTLMPLIRSLQTCDCRDALRGALATDPSVITDEVRKRLGPILEAAIPSPS